MKYFLVPKLFLNPVENDPEIAYKHSRFQSNAFPLQENRKPFPFSSILVGVPLYYQILTLLQVGKACGDKWR